MAIVSTGNTASWDEASRCYYCQQEMKEISKRRAPTRLTATVYTLQCMNDDCPYHQRDTARAVHETGDENEVGDRWRKVVEKLADGTVPIRPAGRRGKELPRMPRVSDEAISMMSDRIREEDELIQRLSRQGGEGGRLDPDTGRIIAPPES